MGLEVSSLKNLERNEYLVRLCSPEVISPFDPLWNKLLSHSLKPILSRDEDFILDTSVEKLRGDLFLNNLRTKNVSSLIQVFTSRSVELHMSVQTSDSIFIWQAYNCLFMVRSILKYMLSSLTEDEIQLHFQKSELLGESLVTNGFAPNSHIPSTYDNSIELLLESLCHLLVKLPVTKSTYMLHLEAVNTMVVVLSQQMFITKQGFKFPQYRFLMGGEYESCAELVKSLLENYVEQSKPPYPVWNTSGNGSIVIGMASGIWNMLRKGVGYSPQEDEVMEDLKEHNLAKQSLYLLLLLVNHSSGERKRNNVNPFLAAIVSCKNASDIVSYAEEGQHELPSPSSHTFTTSFAKLYDRICDQITTDETTLLLYVLIFGNPDFMSYIMARCDIENLVLPMLKTLYNAPTSTSHHIYMSLIVLLILSQEDLYNQQVHDVMLKNVSWYTERNMTEISLGGLLILVIIRTIQYNILKMRDKYLHTNCLAALANMSSKFRSLHPYVAQRIISLFETLGKRYVKLLEKSKENSSEVNSELAQDLAVLDEVIRMILEILNSTLSNLLYQNHQLVYTLLYKRDVFEPFRAQDSTQDLVANLDTVINYFTKRLGCDYNNLTASQVMEHVRDGVLHWKPDILKKFPDLKFRYVEEESPEAFFVPYIWTLIFKKSGIHWTSTTMALELYDLDPEIYS